MKPHSVIQNFLFLWPCSGSYVTSFPKVVVFFCVLPPFPTLPSQFSKVWEEEKILFRQSAHLLAGHHKVTKLVTRAGFIWTRLASLALSCSLENTDSPSF